MVKFNAELFRSLTGMPPQDLMDEDIHWFAGFESFCDNFCIMSLFLWSDTPEEHEFWADKNENKTNLENLELVKLTLLRTFEGKWADIPKKVTFEQFLACFGLAELNVSSEDFWE